MSQDYRFYTEYLEKMTKIQADLLHLVENDKKNDVKIFIDKLLNTNVHLKLHELNSVLHLIIQVANNHHRTPNFNNKIFEIIKSLAEIIRKNFTDLELFTMFRSNKLLVHYLITQRLILPNPLFSQIFTSKKYAEKNYLPYFFDCLSRNYQQELRNELVQQFPRLHDIDSSFCDDIFKGENESEICILIRNDSLDEFVEYVKNNKISILTETIKPSMFETNHFLLKRTPTLIEYAAFFGSMKIFTYLAANDCPLTPSLWLYAVHSNNMDVIRFLQSNFVTPESNSYQQLYVEAAKCHHNKLKRFIREKYLQIYDNEEATSLNNIVAIIKACNYDSFPANLIDDYLSTDFLIITCNLPLFQLFWTYANFDLNSVFKQNNQIFTILQYAIRVNNIELVQFILKQPNIDVNMKTVCNRRILTYHNKEFDIEMADEKTALNEAIDQKRQDIIQFLLEYPGIDVNVSSKYSENLSINDIFTNEKMIELTPLQNAIFKKDINTIKLLLQKPGIDINKKTRYFTKDSEMEISALHIAIKTKCLEIVRLLLQRPEIDVNSIFSSKERVTYKYPVGFKETDLNSINNDQKDTVDLCSDDYSNKEMVYYDNNYYKKEETYENFVEEMPIHLAIESENDEILKLLLEKEGININWQKKTILKYSKIFEKNDQNAQNLQKESNINSLDENHSNSIDLANSNSLDEDHSNSIDAANSNSLDINYSYDDIDEKNYDDDTDIYETFIVKSKYRFTKKRKENNYAQIFMPNEKRDRRGIKKYYNFDFGENDTSAKSQIEAEIDKSNKNDEKTESQEPLDQNNNNNNDNDDDDLFDQYNENDNFVPKEKSELSKSIDKEIEQQEAIFTNFLIKEILFIFYEI